MTAPAKPAVESKAKTARKSVRKKNSKETFVQYLSNAIIDRMPQKCVTLPLLPAIRK